VAKAKKGDKQTPPPDNLPRLSAHPRARSHIALAKSWAGLIVFVAVTLLSRGAGLPWFDSLLRGLGAGIVAYLVAWAAAVVVWQNIAKAELEVMRKRTEERLRAAREAAEAADAERDEAGADGPGGS
jgi:uncharacterized membrane protein YccC